MHLSALDWNLARPPSSDGATIAGNNSIFSQPFAKLPGQHLRLHRYILACASLFHQLRPFLHSLLGVFKEPAVFVMIQERQKFFQNSTAVANQANLHRESQANSFRLDFNLYPARLFWLRIIL